MNLKKILCTAVSTVMMMSVCAVNVSAYYDDGYGNLQIYTSQEWSDYLAEDDDLSELSSVAFFNDDTFVVDRDIDLTGITAELQIYCDLQINEGCTLKLPDTNLSVIIGNKNITNNGQLITQHFFTRGGNATIINNGNILITGGEKIFDYEDGENLIIENNGVISSPNTNLITQNGAGASLGTGTGIILTANGKLTYSDDFGTTVYEQGEVPADSTIGVWQGKIGKIGDYPTDTNPSGDTSITLDGKTIPAPTYTVTIPKKVTFGTQAKTNETNIVTTDVNISADGVSNLFANQQKLVVTVESANSFNVTDGVLAASNVPYDFYTAYADKTKLGEDKTVLTLVGTAEADENLTAAQNCTLELDTKNITKAGNFTDTMTFTIALESVGV